MSNGLSASWNLRAQAAQASRRLAGGQPRLSTRLMNASSSPRDGSQPAPYSVQASVARRADARTDHAVDRFADAAGEKNSSSAAPGDLTGVATFSSGGEKSGPSDRRFFTRAATLSAPSASAVPKLRRFRDVVVVVGVSLLGLPRLLRLPPTLRRGAAAVSVGPAVAGQLLRLRAAAASVVLVASLPTARRCCDGGCWAASIAANACTVLAQRLAKRQRV